MNKTPKKLLAEIEKEIILKIEQHLDKKIPLIEEVKWNSVGLVITGGHVTGLGLYNKGLKSLPETISKLRNLSQLKVSSNELKFLPENIERWIAGLKKKGCNVYK